MSLEKTSLELTKIQLIPLEVQHIQALVDVGLYPELWRWQPVRIDSYAKMEKYVKKAMSEYERGVSLPFAIRSKVDGKIIGSTRYMDIAPEHKRLEIGSTWLSPEYQRTGANTEAKYLLLRYAFEELKVMKIVLKTEVGNTQSRKAIAGIGAKEEGIFRKQFIAEGGRIRDMAYYSILDSEWAEVRKLLEDKLRIRNPELSR